MGYANHHDHFLERLSRIDDEQVDFAMALYHDPQFVRVFLEHQDIPDGYERVAVAIEDGPQSPHIVLARDGGFVTCLGAGMRPNGLYVISRKHMEATRQIGDMLEASIQRLVDEGWSAQGLEKTVLRKAFALHRDDFDRLEALRPLLLKRAVMTMEHMPAPLWERRRMLEAHLGRKVKRLRGKQEELVKAYWEDFFFMHHMSGLIALSTEQLADITGPAGFCTCFANLPWWTLREGMLGPSLRALWAAARMGEVIGDRLLDELRQPTDVWKMSATLPALMAIATRHPRLHAPLSRTLRGWRDGIKQIPDAKRTALQQVKQSLAASALTYLDSPDACQYVVESLGRIFYEGLYKMPDLFDTSVFGDPEGLDAQQALAVLSFMTTDVRGFDNRYTLLLAAAPLVARADIRDLYVPRDFAHKIDGWVAPYATRLFQDHANARPTPKPARADDTPGRNDPCHCGSGRKYKRCCMRADAS